MLIYSYAIHLRKGSYRNLPLSRPNTSFDLEETELAAEDEEDEEIEDFYHVPVRNPTSSSHPTPNGSPGRPGTRSSAKSHSISKPHPLSRSNSNRTTEGGDGDVLFDEDDIGRSRTKYGAREGNAAEDEHAGLVGSNRV